MVNLSPSPRGRDWVYIVRQVGERFAGNLALIISTKARTDLSLAYVPEDLIHSRVGKQNSVCASNEFAFEIKIQQFSASLRIKLYCAKDIFPSTPPSPPPPPRFAYNQIQPFIIVGPLLHISSSWTGPRRAPVVTSTIFKYRTLPTSVDDFWEALVSNLGLRARSYSHCCVSG